MGMYRIGATAGDQHARFPVEDVESFKEDLKSLVNRNPVLSPKPGGTEGDIRLKLLSKCKHGQFQLPRS